MSMLSQQGKQQPCWHSAPAPSWPCSSHNANMSDCNVWLDLNPLEQQWRSGVESAAAVESVAAIAARSPHMSARMKYIAVYVCVGSWLLVSRQPTRLQVSPSSHCARNQLLSASTL